MAEVVVRVKPGEDHLVLLKASSGIGETQNHCQLDPALCRELESKANEQPWRFPLGYCFPKVPSIASKVFQTKGPTSFVTSRSAFSGNGCTREPSEILLALKLSEVQLKNVKCARTPLSVGVSDHILALGGPVAVPMVRQLMEYIKVDNLCVRRPDPMVHLEYTFFWGGLKAKRYERGQENPGIASIIRGPLPNKYLVLDVDEEGWLTSSYLLVTVMPNVLSRESVAKGSTATVIAGSQTCGMNGVTKLLTDEKLLKELKGRLSGWPFWQAVFRVAVSHDHRRKESLATGVKLAETQGTSNPVQIEVIPKELEWRSLEKFEREAEERVRRSQKDGMLSLFELNLSGDSARTSVENWWKQAQ